MKRLTKIFVAVLTVMLIASVIIAAASVSAAAVNGITVKASDDFETVAPSFGGTASDGTNPRTSKGTIFQQGGRTGVVSTVSSSPYEDNQYVVITQDDKNGSTGPYMWASVGARPTAESLNNSADDMSKYSYYAFDIDVMSPTGKFIAGACIDFSARCVNSSQTVTFWNNTAINNVIVFDNDESGSYVYISGTSVKKYIDPYSFNHITCIIEPSTSSSAYSATIHLYVNGKYVNNKTGSTSTTSYYSGTPHASIIEYRLNYKAIEDITQTLAVDNVSFRAFDKSYDGNLSTVLAAKNNLSSWESNLYSAADMPLGFLKVVNETKDTYYSTLSEAVSAASAGDVIKVNSDQTTAVTVGKAITIKTAKSDGTCYNVSLSAASGYTMSNIVTGEYKFILGSTPTYEYVSGGSAVTAMASEKTLFEVISAADSGTTIKVNSDITVERTVSYNLSKYLTINLNGNTMVANQSYKVPIISINASKTLNIENGTIISGYSDATYAGVGYPLFGLQSNAKLNITNVNTYSATFVWSYGGNNSSVFVNGGEHHLYIPSTDVCGGFVESRTNMTFEANDATFYCPEGSGTLFSSLHYRAPNTITKKSTFTYNNCKIYGTAEKTNLIRYSNEFTTAIFNNCDIFGSLTPGIHEWEISQPSEPHAPAKLGGVVLGEGCRIPLDAVLSDIVVMGQGYELRAVSSSESVTLKIASGNLADGNFSIGESTNVYKYAYAANAVEFHTVTWYKEDGKTVIKTEQLAPGSIATPPEYTPTNNESNGWFIASYNGWATSHGGTKTTDFTVQRDTAYYPAVSTANIKASLKAAQYNLSLIGSIGINFYLPKAPNGIIVKGVFGSDGKEIFGKTVYIGNTPYTSYSIGDVGATELSTAKTITVSYSVSGTTLEAVFSLSPYKYATTVLLDSLKADKTYPESAHRLVADMVRYSNNLTKYLNYATGGTVAIDSTVDSLYNTYSSLCSALPENFDDVSEFDVSGLSGYVKSATFEVSKYQPAYKFEFVNGSGVVDCYITMNGYYSSPISGANFGSVTYTSSNKSYYSGDYLSSAYIRGVPMYNVDSTITITVLLENGMTKTGTYNLNAYYKNVAVADNTARGYLESFLQSLRAFSTSTKKYRYATVEITEANAVDFRNCDHVYATTKQIQLNDGLIPVTYIAKYCSTCDNHLVYYSDYGVTGKGFANDFANIRKAHNAANAIIEAFPQYTVTVVSGVGTFYIADPDDGGANAIAIKTNVDWDGAHFIIDDVEIDLDGGERASAKQSIFKAVGINSKRGSGFTHNLPLGIPMGATNIGYAPGEKLMLSISNKSVKHYIRYGANVNSGANQSEVIIVDEYGNVDPTTPVQWDYTNAPYCSYSVESANKNSNKVVMCTPVDSNTDGVCDTCSTVIGKSFAASAYSADDKPIIISGLDKDGNINCIWETRTSSNVSVATYNQIARNINIMRSNTTVEGIDRWFIEDDTNTTPRQTYAAYVNVSYAYNTVIKDMLVQDHLSHYDVNGTLLGSYEFGGGSSINTSWINCRIKNFFKAGGKVTYSGMFGTNYMRNSYLKDCVLTSFDSHSGAYNVTIEDSTFEHINFVGGGDAIMKNVTVYVDGGFAACILRTDYGSMWKGNLKIDGLTLLHSSSYSRSYIDIVRASYTNHYFGYTTYNPIKIYANNVKIKQFNRTSAEYTMVGGSIVETNLTSSSKTLGILNNLNSEFKNASYDYSTINANNLNPKICTEAVYITNSNVKISYPTHKYFKNMKVYINGVQQNWYTGS